MPGRVFRVIGILVVLTNCAWCQIELLSNGNGGVRCGPSGLRCLAGQANCGPTDTCNCQGNRFNPNRDGFLSCHRDTELWTGAVNDPILRTLTNERYDLPITCRYLMTHLESNLLGRNSEVLGTCMFVLSGFHGKDRGKYYLQGVDVALRIVLNNNPIYELSARIIGSAVNGSYNYTALARSDAFNPDGPWGTDSRINFRLRQHRIVVSYGIDRANNYVHFRAKKCGIRFRFRSFDTALRRDQNYLPGLALSLNTRENEMTFLSVDKTMLLVPPGFPDHAPIANITPNFGKPGTMIDRALTSGIVQNQPVPNPACDLVGPSLTSCAASTRRDAYHRCLWVLQSPRFVHCINEEDKTGQIILDLFRFCMDVFCGSQSCDAFIAMIQASGCHTTLGYSGLTNFLARRYC